MIKLSALMQNALKSHENGLKRNAAAATQPATAATAAARDHFKGVIIPNGLSATDVWQTSELFYPLYPRTPNGNLQR